jgi:hypothetical protein
LNDTISSSVHAWWVGLQVHTVNHESYE